jgi:hypothetical protein
MVLRTLRANDDETSDLLEFTLEGRGHTVPWSCRPELTNWPPGTHNGRNEN